MGKKGSNRIPVKKGDKFNDWTVLKEDWTEESKSGAIVTYVKVKCKCGHVRVSRKHTIQRGVVKKCRKCKEKEGFDNGRFKGYKDLGGYYIGQLKEGASKRNLEFNLTPFFLWNLLESQDFKCALSGLGIKLSRSIDYKTKIQTASLDRIDNEKGYTKDNVQWVHKYINQMKSNRSEEEFITLCKAVVDYNSKKR